MSKVAAGGLLAGALLTLSSSAFADIAEGDYQDYEAPPHERRCGFALGLSYAPGYITATGYPNKLDEIGVAEFEQSVSGLGFANTIWLGGALRDWLSFGVGITGRSDSESKLQGGGLIFHVEGFPLFSLGGTYRDIGVFGDFGAGGISIIEDDEVVADGGFVSMAGGGVFWEPWQFWHFSSGPIVQYAHEFSESISVHSATLGIRTVFYGSQP